MKNITLQNWEEKFKKQYEPVYYRVKRCLHIWEITELRENIKELIEKAKQEERDRIIWEMVEYILYKPIGTCNAKMIIDKLQELKQAN